MAHVDIEPTEEWQREIEHALFSMDALVALLTDDYHDSNWTDQEIGVAIGRSCPIIPIRLGLDPYGFIGRSQGLAGCSLSDSLDTAIKIFDLLHKRLPDKSRLFEATLSAYSASTNFADSGWKVEHLLSKFATLTPNQVQGVLDAYRNNSQNENSWAGMERLKPLLKRWTGNDWQIRDNKIVLNVSDSVSLEDEIPF